MTENYSVTTKLKYLIKSEDKLMADEGRDEIESFYNRLRFLGAILKDMEEKHHEENDDGENLAMQISYATYKTGEFLSFFVAEVAKQRDSNNNGKSICLFDFLNLTNILEQIKPIKLKAMQFYDMTYQIQLLQDEKFFDEVQSTSIGNRTMEEEEIMVGFDDEALTIKERLAGRKKQLDFVWIVGMPGLGKTTLARKLYYDPYITHYFHIRAWTYASQLPRKTDMLLDILRSVNVIFTDEDKSLTNEKLGKKLYKQLKGKRYLIVIDDLWNIGVWVDLKMYFPNDNNGSRVMFTSRLKELAMHASPDCHPHCLRFLTEEECWELFQQKVFQNESCPPELTEIGKQLMKKCKGLPLAIVVIAGLLAKNKKTQESGKQVAHSVSSYIVSDPNQYLDTLALSYNHMPRHLKPCFLYLGSFPEDQEISVSLEEVAEDYLMDLIQRSMVIVARKRFDGRIKACCMHDLLRDLCLKKAKEINFLHWIYNYKHAYPSSSDYTEKNQCRLCIHSDFSGKFDQIPFESYSAAVAQSFLWFGNMPEKEIGYCNNALGDVSSFICWTFKLLRVLELGPMYLAINLKGCYELPPSISNLSNLETLIIFTRWTEVILPCSLWKIQTLRHLYAKGGAKFSLSLCSEEVVLDHNHPSVLENLQTISKLNPCGLVQDILATTPYLTKLGICGEVFSFSENLMFPNLEFLRHLETLKIRHQFLHSTNLRDIKFPTNVKRLTLKSTFIEWDEISVLGMLLPDLELLKLENYAACGRQWVIIDGGFPRLKFLKLKELKVKRWITCSSYFPSLQHLLLEWCENLEEIPSSLGDILTLQMIEVNLCHFSVEESVRKIKEEQESIGNNWLKVLIKKFSWDF
ncbi:unnamed protein product [Camellia sinensis]